MAGAEPHGDWMLDGYSVIVDPTGTVLAGPLVREEGILYAELDLDAARGPAGACSTRWATTTAPTCSAWSSTTAPNRTWSPWRGPSRDRPPRRNDQRNDRRLTARPHRRSW